MIIISYALIANTVYAMELGPNSVCKQDADVNVKKPNLYNFTDKEFAVFEIINTQEIHDSRALVNLALFVDRNFKAASKRLQIVKEQMLKDSHCDTIDPVEVTRGVDEKLDQYYADFIQFLAQYIDYTRKMFAITPDDLIPSWQEVAQLARKLHAQDPLNILLQK